MLQSVAPDREVIHYADIRPAETNAHVGMFIICLIWDEHIEIMCIAIRWIPYAIDVAHVVCVVRVRIEKWGPFH